MTDWLPAATAIGGALAGGPVWTYLAAKLKIGQSQRQMAKEEVTDLRAQVAALAASQNSFLARWFKDRERKLIWVNDLAYMTLFAPLGLTREELQGRTFLELGFSKDAVGIIEDLDRLALKHPGVPQSHMVEMPDGQMLVVLKVSGVGSDGELRYEGSAYPPIRVE